MNIKQKSKIELYLSHWASIDVKGLSKNNMNRDIWNTLEVKKCHLKKVLI